MLAVPTPTAVHHEMDRRYPNRVLMDVGLVICRHGDCLKIGDGGMVNGDGGAHHECLVKLVIFRPFVEEVCVGKIIKSTPDGIQVSLGFFQDIFIPPYWMLRPSRYESKTGLWVWEPKYDDDDDDDDNNNNNNNDDDEGEGEADETGQDTNAAGVAVKQEGGDKDPSEEKAPSQEVEKEADNRYEMEIGAQVRIKVKSINFTQVTSTAKGMQATTTTTAQAHGSMHPNMMSGAGGSSSDGNTSSQHGGTGGSAESQPVRKRSLSMDLTESQNVPATMHVVASICEDGLGLTSWWAAPEEDGDDEDAEENEEAAEL
jgi:DNA-directed RNA polymerase III subunit RPC8